MPKITQMSSHLADLIAAGEVVERPSSVVKELVENAVDAGATVITIEIKAGGMTFIRVTDNGCGIAPEDAKTAFLRHATSKLRDERGLEAIGTLGFRGEALAAIAAVSRIEMLTRECGGDEGTRVTLEGSAVTDCGSAGCPEGTTIIVRDLFYNTPARLKFMKTDRAEATSVTGVALRLALSRPDISIRYIRDGREEYHTPGDGRAESCVYSLLGREFMDGLLSASADDENVTVTGYISNPAAARGNRNYQYFFLNGRHIRSKTLQAAVEQAYRNNIAPGRFPACVLYITVRESAVDVNVHPAKTEVRFLSDKQVYDGVYYAALGAIEGGSRAAAPQISAGTRAAVDYREPERVFAQPVQAERPSGGAAMRGTVTSTPGGFKSMQADDFRAAYSPGTFKSRVPDMPERDRTVTVHDENIVPYQTRMTAIPPENAEAPRVLGEAFKTYIIAEHGRSLWLIDKHAAHERIHFDRLRAGDDIMEQALIEPIICRTGAEDAELLRESADILSRIGFAIDRFGEDAVAVRRIPSDIDASGIEALLGEICDKLRCGGSADAGMLHDGVMSTVACKAAIKAGRSSDLRELAALALRVLSGEIRYCPHGRPVAHEMPRTSIDRYFKRT